MSINSSSTLILDGIGLAGEMHTTKGLGKEGKYPRRMSWLEESSTKNVKIIWKNYTTKEKSMNLENNGENNKKIQYSNENGVVADLKNNSSGFVSLENNDGNSYLKKMSKLDGNLLVERLKNLVNTRPGCFVESKFINKTDSGNGVNNGHSFRRRRSSGSFIVGAVFQDVVIYEVFQSRKLSKGENGILKELSDKPTQSIVRSNSLSINAGKVLGSANVVELASHKNFVCQLQQKGWQLKFVFFEFLKLKNDYKVDSLAEFLYSDAGTFNRIYVITPGIDNFEKIGKSHKIIFWHNTHSEFSQEDEQLTLDFLTYSTKSVVESEKKQFSQIEFSLGPDVTKKLRKLNWKYSKDEELSRCYLSQLTYGILLHKYTGKDKCSVSSKISTENGNDSILDIVTFKFGGEKTVSDLIEQIESRECFDISNKLSKKVESVNGDTKRVSKGSNVTESDELVIEEVLTSKSELKYFVKYDSRRINADLLAQFIESYKKLYREILDDLIYEGSRTFNEYDVLNDEQLNRILNDWNATDRDPLGVNAVQLFEQQVAKFPNAVAVCAADTKIRLTYEELNVRANRLANHLRSYYKILSQDDLVAVSMERSPELIVAMLAILKAGGVYVPIDPKYPKERIEHMLTDSTAKVVLTQKHFLEMFESGDNDKKIQALALDDEKLSESLTFESSANLVVGTTTRDSLAYIIYTSGSTGKPKGVMIKHSNLTNYLHYVIENYLDKSSPEELKKIPLCSSISFDLTITSLFTPLVCGLPIFICSPASTSFDDMIQEFYMNVPFNFIKLTPSHLDLIKPYFERRKDTSLTKTFIVGGENLSYAHVQSLIESHEGTVIVNEYGPTETTVGCTTYYLTKSDYENKDNCIWGGGSVPIGKPMANTQIYVLGSNMNVCPVGVIGEIYVGGAGVGKGYWNRVELTTDKFVPNPWAKSGPMHSKHLYKTGDLGRFLPDGNLLFLGRIDDQVKVNGFRIELGEIESVVAQHPLIQQCTVCVENGKQLVAYVRLEGGSDIIFNCKELRAYASKELPVHMIPTSFVVVRHIPFPLSPGGKVDKKKLTGLGLSKVDESETYVAPRNNVEQILCDLWQEILNLVNSKPVGIDDDFFTIGGNSILCIQLIGKLKEILPTIKGFSLAQVDLLNVGHVFKHKTIRNLCDNVLKKTDSLVKARRARFWGNMSVDSSSDSNRILSQLQNLHETELNSQDIILETLSMEVINKIYGTRTKDILLAAFVQSLIKVNVPGISKNQVLLVQDGQDSFPIRFEVNACNVGQTLKNVKEMLRQAEKLQTVEELGDDCLAAHKIYFSVGKLAYIPSDKTMIHLHFGQTKTGIISKFGTLTTKLINEKADALAEGIKTNLNCLMNICSNRHDREYTMSDFPDFEPYIFYHANGNASTTILDGAKRIFMFPPALGTQESYLSNIFKHLERPGHEKSTKQEFVLFNNWYKYMSNKHGSTYTSRITLESIATDYICYIKSIQVTGPYNLFGWSFGGLLAFEICRQLIIAGDWVNDVILVDPLFNYRAAISSSASNDYQFFIANDFVNWSYNPEKLALNLNNKTNIVLFKAELPVVRSEGDINWMSEEYLHFYNTFKYDEIYKYYAKQTKYNHLDTILETDDFILKRMAVCNHFSWLYDDEQIDKICKYLR